MIRNILFVGMLALSACATQNDSVAQAADGPRECFQARDITAQEALDDRTIKWTARNVDYLVTINGNARQLNFSQPVIINTHGSQICTGNGLNVTMHIGRDPAIPVIVRQIARAPDTQPQG